MSLHRNAEPSYEPAYELSCEITESPPLPPSPNKIYH